MGPREDQRPAGRDAAGRSGDRPAPGRRAGDRRLRRPQGRECDGARGQAVPGIGREDRPWRGHGDHLLGGRARLLPAARRALPPPPTTSRTGRTTRASVRSCRSEPLWPGRRRKREWSCGRWPPTAPTATRTASAVNWPMPDCRSSWRSSPATAPGPTATRRTLPSMPPAPWPGTTRTSQATGARSPAPSATGTPPPGGPQTRTWAGGAPTETSAWSWPPPTRPPCPHSPPGIWPPDLPRPGGPRAAESPIQPADLTEIVRIYGLRDWIEQSCKQVKDELGWADFQVRSDSAIRRHQTLVTCAFSFCWDTWFAPPPRVDDQEPTAGRAERGPSAVPSAPPGQLAQGDPGRPWLADALDHAATLLASLDSQAPAHRTPEPDQRRQHRKTHRPLHPGLTNHR